MRAFKVIADFDIRQKFSGQLVATQKKSSGEEIFSTYWEAQKAARIALRVTGIVMIIDVDVDELPEQL